MRGKKVLVTDDEPVTLETLGAQLRGVGFQVVTAMDAMQAFIVAEPKARALGLGALEFFDKPVDFERLRESLARLFESPDAKE